MKPSEKKERKKNSERTKKELAELKRRVYKIEKIHCMNLNGRLVSSKEKISNLGNKAIEIIFDWKKE